MMSRMGEKVAYLKGLAEGMRLDAESDQGKLLLAMIDAMEAFASGQEETCAQLDELQQYVEEIDSDVSDLEEALFSEDEDDEDCYATTCPTCEETIYFDESILEDGEVICPNCGEKLEFDLSDLANAVEDGEDEE